MNVYRRLSAALLSASLVIASACAPSDASKPAASASTQGAPVPAKASANFDSNWLSRRRLPLPAAPGAKVTVVIFLDWQCPACRMAEQAYNIVFAGFENRTPGAVAVVLKDYPLNSRCNPNVPVEMHAAACEAAVAVRLAREHNTAQSLIDFLFANQESLTPESVKAAAAKIGKVTDFDARYQTVLKDVMKDIGEGKAFEVGGTPTVYINGILARNDEGRSLFSPEEVRLAIEAELKREK